MDHKDFSNLGEKLRKSVQNAIDTADFQQISRTVTDTLNDAVAQAHNGLERARASARTATSRRAASAPPPVKPAMRVRRTGRTAGVLCTVFGALGIAFFGGIAALGLVGTALLASPLSEALQGLAVLAMPIAVFGGMLGAGKAMLGRLRRLQRYVDAVGTRDYCLVERLAESVHKSTSFVTRDLRGILRRGMLPDAHIDEEGGCLILDESVYQLYLQSQQEAQARRAASAAHADEPPTPQTAAPMGAADEMLTKGQAYIDELHAADRAIGKEEISCRLRKLEMILQSIFISLRKYPEQADEMDRFIEYYLPTTVKLVQAYRDFDGVKIQGENLQSAKAEIEKTLDTINDAFERVLNDLYQDAAFDAAADASVLQAMLAKDGLIGSDFEKEEKTS